MVKFSIVVPLYNKQDYIKETLYSILNQTYKNFEIIIVDDLSTDNSLSIVKNVKHAYLEANIKIIEKKTNSGVSDSRNIGMKEVTGNYIIFLDADDEIHDIDFLNEISRLILQYDMEYILVKRNYYNKYEKPTFKSNIKGLKKMEENLFRVTDNPFIALKGSFPFGGSASAIVKSNLIKNKKFEISEKKFEDWLFFIDIYLDATVFFYDKTGIKINIDEKSLSNTADKETLYNLPKLYKYLEQKRLESLKKRFFWIWLATNIKNHKKKESTEIIIKNYRKLMVENFSINKYSIYVLFFTMINYFR